MRSPTTSAIARVAYEATRAYRGVLGREEGPIWPAASSRQRHRALVGVQAVLSGEARSGAHLHELWVRWLDACALSGPEAPSYDQLHIADRRRILLFRAVVLALVDGPCHGECHDERCPVLDEHDCHLDTCMSRFGVPPGLWKALQSDAGMRS